MANDQVNNPATLSQEENQQQQLTEGFLHTTAYLAMTVYNIY